VLAIGDAGRGRILVGFTPEAYAKALPLASDR
jgi:hypothetical protein